MTPQKEFDEAVREFYGSPFEARRLLFAAAAVRGSIDRLPQSSVDEAKRLTGVRHNSYGSAANAIFETMQFHGSGNCMSSFLTEGPAPGRTTGVATAGGRVVVTTALRSEMS